MLNRIIIRVKDIVVSFIKNLILLFFSLRQNFQKTMLCGLNATIGLTKGLVWITISSELRFLTSFIVIFQTVKKEFNNNEELSK